MKPGAVQEAATEDSCRCGPWSAVLRQHLNDARSGVEESTADPGRSIMYRFLISNYAELVARCAEKVSRRPRRAATSEQLVKGVPLFLSQLINTLEAEDEGSSGESLRISGASGGGAPRTSEIGASAAVHGRALLELGYSVDQVVHDYGDICQAITDLAVEREAPFSVNEFRTLNRCLDNAIANAVTEFGTRRDAMLEIRRTAHENERRGMLVHELRNYLQAATMACRALEHGSLPVGGATGALLKRSLDSMDRLLSASVEEVRTTHRAEPGAAFPLAAFIAEAANAASLDAASRGCELTVPTVDRLLAITGDRDRLLAALGNLLQNAFKFTRPGTEVALHAYAVGDRVSIDVADQCGGLPEGSPERMFSPFTQRGQDRSGLGLGLSIARQCVEADGGSLSVVDVPGKGCVFTMSLPRRLAP
jgi:signal transduction histidine kinase